MIKVEVNPEKTTQASLRVLMVMRNPHGEGDLGARVKVRKSCSENYFLLINFLSSRLDFLIFFGESVSFSNNLIYPTSGNQVSKSPWDCWKYVVKNLAFFLGIDAAVPILCRWASAWARSASATQHAFPWGRVYIKCLLLPGVTTPTATMFPVCPGQSLLIFLSWHNYAWFFVFPQKCPSLHHTLHKRGPFH